MCDSLKNYFEFSNMSEEDILRFQKVLGEVNSLSELINRGYSIGGYSGSEKIVVYKDPPHKIVITN